jgi:hypothetical protein
MNVKLWSQPLATTKVPRRQENKPPLASFKKILEASNIDQRFVMASRDDAAIIAPFESSRRSTSTNLGMPEILGMPGVPVGPPRKPAHRSPPSRRWDRLMPDYKLIPARGRTR